MLLVSASLSIEDGTFDVAEEHLTAIEQIEPDNALLYYLRGKLLFKDNRPQEAIKAWKKLVIKRPGEKKARFTFLLPEIERFQRQFEKGAVE